MRLVRFGSPVTVFTLLAASSVALAQGTETKEDPDAGGEAGGDAAAPPDDTNADAAPTPAPTPEPTVATGGWTFTKASYPDEISKQPITVPKGMFMVTGAVSVGLTTDLVGQPITIAPNLLYGVSDKLQVGLVHPRGICLNGEIEAVGTVIDDLCNGELYNDPGLDVSFAFMTGSLNLGGHLTAQVRAFDPFLFGIKVGVIGKFRAGKLSVLFDPGVYVGITERDGVMMAPSPNPDVLSVPVQVGFQANSKLFAFLATGIDGGLSGFGDSFVIPLGVGAFYTVASKLNVGASFTFPGIAGSDLASADARTLALLAQWHN